MGWPVICEPSHWITELKMYLISFVRQSATFAFFHLIGFLFFFRSPTVFSLPTDSNNSHPNHRSGKWFLIKFKSQFFINQFCQTAMSFYFCVQVDSLSSFVIEDLPKWVADYHSKIESEKRFPGYELYLSKNFFPGQQQTWRTIERRTEPHFEQRSRR